MKKGVISRLSGGMSGLWQIVFEDGSSCSIESGFGVRQLVNCFGSINDIKGKAIEYKVDEFGVLVGFNPIDIEI